MYDLLHSRSWLAMLIVAATAAAPGCDVESQAYPGGGTPAAVTNATAAAGLDTAVPIHASFPAASCRTGYRQAGARMCISTNVQAAATWPSATSACRNNRGRVCSYEDLTYLYRNSNQDASYDPSGRWIGNMPSDDQVFCGNASITSDNDGDIDNFEGTCAKTDVRGFWCCHDDQE